MAVNAWRSLDWRPAGERAVLVDEAVAAVPLVVVGGGLRRSELMLPGKAVADLPGAEILAPALAR